MKVVPTIKITQDFENMKKVLTRYRKYNINTFQFSVTRNSLEEHIEFINSVKELYKKLFDDDFNIMLNTPCPKDKIRFEFMGREEEIRVNCHEKIILTNKKDFICEEDIKCFVVRDSFIGRIPEIAIIGDGDLLIKITEIKTDYMIAYCMNDAIVKKGKAIASPQGFLKNTSDDIVLKTLEIIKQVKPEICILSYIENKSDIYNFVQKIKEYAGYTPHIMSKIESKQGVNNTEEIAKNSDSVMIARGCLAVTVGIEKMAKAQDQSIKICKGCNTDVCVASNILRSLNNRNWPLRSDICDLAHMIIGGIKYFVITDGFCMDERFDKLMYYLKNTYDVYNDSTPEV